MAGDFNQWDIGEALLDFPDLKEAPVGPTRQDLLIDKIYTNLSRSINEAGTLSPLETEDGTKKSDHRVAFCKAEIEDSERLPGKTTPTDTTMKNPWNDSSIGSSYTTGTR